MPWKLKGYDFDQRKDKNPPAIFNIVLSSIDRGIPVQTGEEDDGIIVGHDKEKRRLICLHLGHLSRNETFIVSRLADICWNVTVYTEPKTRLRIKQNL